MLGILMTLDTNQIRLPARKYHTKNDGNAGNIILKMMVWRGECYS